MHSYTLNMLFLNSIFNSILFICGYFFEMWPPNQGLIIIPAFNYPTSIFYTRCCTKLNSNMWENSYLKANIMNVNTDFKYMYLYEWFCLSLGIGLILSVFKKINIFSFKKQKESNLFVFIFWWSNKFPNKPVSV